MSSSGLSLLANRGPTPAATLLAGLSASTDVIYECPNYKLQTEVTRVYIRDRREVEQAKTFDALGALLSKLVSSDRTVKQKRR